MLKATAAIHHGASAGKGLWPVLVVLLAAVLVPTSCVLWFLNQAVRNERLAVRQKLSDVYREQLDRAGPQFRGFWQERQHALDSVHVNNYASILIGVADARRQHALDSVHVNNPSALAQAQAAQAVGFDALVVPADALVRRSEAPLAATAPTTLPAAMTAPTDRTALVEEALAKAQGLEFQEANYPEALKIYQLTDLRRVSANLWAQFYLGQARCLLKLGQKKQALFLADIVGASADARDDQGRLLAANARLLVLESTEPAPNTPLTPIPGGTFEAAKYGLIFLLTVPGQPAMPPAQRVFVMERLRERTGQADLFPTYPAEALALAYQEAEAQQLAAGNQSGPLKSSNGHPQAAPLPTTWQMVSADGSLIGLLNEATLARSAEALLRTELAFPNATLKLLPPAANSTTEPAPLIAAPAADFLPGWRLAVYLNGPDPFGAAAEHQVAVYLWTGLLGVAAIVLLACAAAYVVNQQMRLARLKNDLIATVSHELKTPLASMRVLVDTLREGRCNGPKQMEEYFDLISHENERLSRLIDNFLTFSRMERNKRVFDFAPLEVAPVVHAAVDAVTERFAAPGCRLDVDVAADLPQIYGDREALTTVLVNLLDNAWKYSGEQKIVAIRAFADNGSVGVEVADNGIGMSRRAMKRIFDRFYQVDQTLTRKAGGCGLGLSIVKFILEAHGGTITVVSQIGKGSTFTVRLPVTSAEAAHAR